MMTARQLGQKGKPPALPVCSLAEAVVTPDSGTFQPARVALSFHGSSSPGRAKGPRGAAVTAGGGGRASRRNTHRRAGGRRAPASSSSSSGRASLRGCRSPTTAVALRLRSAWRFCSASFMASISEEGGRGVRAKTSEGSALAAAFSRRAELGLETGGAGSPPARPQSRRRRPAAGPEDLPRGAAQPAAGTFPLPERSWPLDAPGSEHVVLDEDSMGGHTEHGERGWSKQEGTRAAGPQEGSCTGRGHGRWNRPRDGVAGPGVRVPSRGQGCGSALEQGPRQVQAGRHLRI